MPFGVPLLPDVNAIIYGASAGIGRLRFSVGGVRRSAAGAIIIGFSSLKASARSAFALSVIQALGVTCLTMASIPADARRVSIGIRTLPVLLMARAAITVSSPSCKNVTT